ncbi:hypothetical protein C4J81_18975 (plasmid) [Deltaproteobacteria bacterium Smac51]|nr:hypothetical protein C4J81_18975 [Deltaproteobacteria bacterium Smac51]
MDLRKKAGLALALAAIFTTGGANLAFASANVTAPNADVVKPGNELNATTIAPNPTTGDVALTGELVGTTLTVAEGAKTVTLTDTTLSGTGSGDLVVDAKGNAVNSVNVADAGYLQMGDEDSDAPATQGGHLKQVAFNAAGNTGAVLGVEGNGTFDVDKITTIGTAGGTGDVNIWIEGVATGTTAGTIPTLNVGTIDLRDIGGDTNIWVGGNEGSGQLTVGTLLAPGAFVFIDPIWIDNVYNPSQAAVAEIGTDTNRDLINASLVVGRNSQLTLGYNSLDNVLSNLIADRFHKTTTGVELVWGTGTDVAGKHFITAAMSLEGSFEMDINDGNIWVDGTTRQASPAEAGGGINVYDPIFTTGGTNKLLSASGIAANNTAYFGEQSMLVVDASEIRGTAALRGDQTPGNPTTKTYIADTANLYVVNAKAGETVTILEDMAGGAGASPTGSSAGIINGTDTITGRANPVNQIKGWSGDYLHFDSRLITAGATTITPGAAATGSSLTVTGEQVSAQSIYPKLSSGMASMVNSLYGGFRNDGTGENDIWSDNAGIRFVSRATSDLFAGFVGNEKNAVAVLEGAAQIAVAAGVPAVANNVITKAASLVVDHNNLLNDTQPAYGNEPGQVGIWVTPFYGFSDVDGMDSGKLENGYEISYGGAAFGVDYNVNESFRLGLALNVGGGDTESQGDYYKTENDFDFFGVSVYGSYTNGAWGLTGDIGYTAIDNEIDQKLPAEMGMGSKLRADVDSDAFTVGLTGQYRFTTSNNLNITPHLGMRYTKISTDDANVKAGSERVFKVDTEDQNLFQIPLGVKFSGDIITDGGWTITPSADLGVLFTMGDTDVDSKARIVGTGFRGTTNSDVVDSAAFTGALGIKAKADNGLSLGLDYGILASGNQTDHSVSGMLRFEF